MGGRKKYKFCFYIYKYCFKVIFYASIINLWQNSDVHSELSLKRFCQNISIVMTSFDVNDVNEF